MNRIEMMKNKLIGSTAFSISGRKCPLRIMALLFMTITSFPSHSYAQPVEEEASQSSASVAEQEQDDMASDEESAEQSAAEEQSERPDIDSQPIESDTSNRPGRFIPSEQISLDLGVSFPVDV